MSIPAQVLDDRARELLVLVSAKARRDQDDARVGDVRRDSVVSEPEEVDDVPGDDRPPFAGGLLELGTVVELAIADIVGARGVYAVLSEEDRDAR